ncbi:unnamed protein product [Umbelopsis ramanniana]
MTTTSAPQPTLNFAITATELKKSIDDIMAQELEVNNKVAGLAPEKQTFETVILPMSRVDNAVAGEAHLATNLSYFSPEKDVRDASLEADKAYDAFGIEQGMRVDLYEAVLNVFNKTDLATLDPEDARLLTKTELDFRRSGLALEESKRNELKEIRKKLSELGIDFSKNLNEESSTVSFTKDELENMDDDFLSGLKTEEVDGVQKYILTMRYPDVLPVLKNCKNENTRRIHYIAYESRNKENIAILEEAVKLRRQAAKLLGYPSHAAFILEVKMAKSVETVQSFLKDLVDRLEPIGEKELERLKNIKRKEKESRGEEYDGNINGWDTAYYLRILLEEEYQVDQQVIQQYFPLSNTVDRMLEIYSKVLGLRFVKVPADTAVVWHPDVQLYECWDDTDTQEFSGYMYLDLHPRENKYSHAACFPLQPSYLKENGDRVAPSAAMVANFTKPTADKPSLLKHDEVVTLFHELGHVMHHICSRTKHTRFNGTAVERDFVEAPSQMLENWCFDSQSLKYLSSHYQTGAPIPDEIIDRIVKAKNVNGAMFNLRQLFFGIYDMTLHTSDDEKLDTSVLWHKLRKEVSLINSPEGTYGQAAFGHIMGGYDAGYYGYLWSKVFSTDMFYTKFNNNTLSRDNGLAYRHKILSRGGSRDGMDLLRDFLEREPSSDAFMKELMSAQ